MKRKQCWEIDHMTTQRVSEGFGRRQPIRELVAFIAVESDPIAVNQ